MPMPTAPRKKCSKAALTTSFDREGSILSSELAQRLPGNLGWLIDNSLGGGPKGEERVTLAIEQVKMQCFSFGRRMLCRGG